MKVLLKAMNPEEKEALDHEICKRLSELPIFSEAAYVYGYMSLSWETGTKEILGRLFRQGVNVALPKVLGSEMDFFEVSSMDDLNEGTFRILEPKDGCKKAEWPHAVLLVPGIAFSRDGKRLGKGGGYYDKYLEKYPDHKTIALAYDFQIMEEIPVADHDRRVDVIVTESGICICGK